MHLRIHACKHPKRVGAYAFMCPALDPWIQGSMHVSIQGGGVVGDLCTHGSKGPCIQGPMHPRIHACRHPGGTYPGIHASMGLGGPCTQGPREGRVFCIHGPRISAPKGVGTCACMGPWIPAFKDPGKLHGRTYAFIGPGIHYAFIGPGIHACKHTRRISPGTYPFMGSGIHARTMHQCKDVPIQDCIPTCMQPKFQKLQAWVGPRNTACMSPY